MKTISKQPKPEMKIQALSSQENKKAIQQRNESEATVVISKHQ